MIFQFLGIRLYWFSWNSLSFNILSEHFVMTWYEDIEHLPTTEQNFNPIQFAYWQGGSCTNALLAMQHVLYEYPDDPNCDAVARMSNTSSLFVCSFSLLGEGQHTLSSSGNFSLSEVFSNIIFLTQWQLHKHVFHYVAFIQFCFSMLSFHRKP